MNEKNTFVAWLGYKGTPDFLKSRAIGGFVGVVLSIVLGLLVLLAILSLVGLLKSAFAFLSEDNKITDPSAAIRNIGLMFAAIIGTPFIVWRSFVAQKQADVAEQGLITDRINKAVEGLGAEKTVKRHRTSKDGKLLYKDKKPELGNDSKREPDFKKPIFDEVTLPNIEVRIGSLFSLERIAQDSPRDHLQVMEIICAYIRENAKSQDAKLSPHEVFDTLTTDTEYGEGLNSETAYKDERYSDVNVYSWKPTELSHSNLDIWAREQLHTREDIQTALTVLGRRTKIQIAQEHSTEYKIDLKKTNLQGAVLRGNFDSAQFSDAKLDGAKLRGSFENAHFGIYGEHAQSGASLQGARCHGIDAKNTDFSGCNLNSAFFGGSILDKCLFRGTKLDHTNFNGTSLIEADFAFAKPSHVYCYQGANFSRSRFYDTKLSEFNGLDGAPSVNVWIEQNVELTSEQEEQYLQRQSTVGELQSRRAWQQWLNSTSAGNIPPA